MSRLMVVLVLLAVVLISLPMWLRDNVGRFSEQGTIDAANVSGDFDQSGRVAVFNSQMLESPSLAEGNFEKQTVLGQSSGEKRIEVDLTHQRLYAYEGNRQVYNFLISSGKWAKTPTGTFRIWTKLRYTLMTGGSKLLNTYYYLPNVPYVMFFANGEVPAWKGFGLHGTYWHSNFGHPMSHGCINMKTEEAAIIYQWADPDLRGQSSIRTTDDNPGTTITIYGEAPAS